jgi:hypothetical protein
MSSTKGGAGIGEFASSISPDTAGKLPAGSHACDKLLPLQE